MVLHGVNVVCPLLVVLLFMFLAPNFLSCTDESSLTGAYAGEYFFEELLRDRGFRIIYRETLSLREQLEIYLGSTFLIFAEGSAQHALELLGFHANKLVFIICRRPQSIEMSYPINSRFPKTIFISSLVSQWIVKGGVPWNGISLLDWRIVCNAINPYLDSPITSAECSNLSLKSEQQLATISRIVPLYKV